MKINICFCIDEGYVCQLGAVLLSLIESNQQNNVDIYLILNGVAEESKARLAKTIKNMQKFSMFFFDSQDKSENKLEGIGHISSATFIRFEIPELLANLDKVLYLDSDIIVADDLTDLWNVELKDNYVGAVENPFFSRYEALSLKPGFGYFNAGVLLMNLKRCREGDICNKAATFFSNNRAACLNFDQCALNAVIQGKWKKVVLRWNLQTNYLLRKKELPNLKKEISLAYSSPGIIHYSSSSKPWDFLDPHPKAYVFHKYERQFGKLEEKHDFTNSLRSIIKFLYRRAYYLHQLN
jgi:lipopolysaccharide biosynthesis glycosyltransferase